MSADARHPDEEWIRGTIASLEAWLEGPSATPTSQITGGGAVGRAEALFAAHHEMRPCLLIPSATFGMRATLKALGVRSDSEVLVPDHDWVSTVAAIQSLGAVAVPVPVERRTATIDPTQIVERRTDRTRAIVACHLHGVPADIPAIRDVVRDLPIIEDGAQALGSTLDGRPVGVLGDAAIFSFGPGKAIDVGEAGIIVARDEFLRAEILRGVGHPVLQILGGIERPALGNFSVRPHPLASVLLAHRLSVWRPDAIRAAHEDLADDLRHLKNLTILGDDGRRANAAVQVPVYVDGFADQDLESYRFASSESRRIRSHALAASGALRVLLASRRSINVPQVSGTDSCRGDSMLGRSDGELPGSNRQDGKEEGDG